MGPRCCRTERTMPSVNSFFSGANQQSSLQLFRKRMLYSCIEQDHYEHGNELSTLLGELLSCDVA
jgi:hypothetical protein